MFKGDEKNLWMQNVCEALCKTRLVKAFCLFRSEPLDISMTSRRNARFVKAVGTHFAGVRWYILLRDALTLVDRLLAVCLEVRAARYAPKSTLNCTCVRAPGSV